MRIKIDASEALDLLDDGDSLTLSVDTAGSWDGDFPIAKGDWIFEIQTVEAGDVIVHVSSRYTSPVNECDAREIAISAVCDRYDIDTDDNGDPLPQTDSGGDTFIPVYVAESYLVTTDLDDSDDLEDDTWGDLRPA